MSMQRLKPFRVMATLTPFCSEDDFKAGKPPATRVIVEPTIVLALDPMAAQHKLVRLLPEDAAASMELVDLYVYLF